MRHYIALTEANFTRKDIVELEKSVKILPAQSRLGSEKIRLFRKISEETNRRWLALRDRAVWRWEPCWVEGGRSQVLFGFVVACLLGLMANFIGQLAPLIGGLAAAFALLATADATEKTIRLYRMWWRPLQDQSSLDGWTDFHEPSICVGMSYLSCVLPAKCRERYFVPAYLGHLKDYIAGVQESCDKSRVRWRSVVLFLTIPRLVLAAGFIGIWEWLRRRCMWVAMKIEGQLDALFGK
jgi:hypothetical protein